MKKYVEVFGADAVFAELGSILLENALENINVDEGESPRPHPGRKRGGLTKAEILARKTQEEQKQNNEANEEEERHSDEANDGESEGALVPHPVKGVGNYYRVVRRNKNNTRNEGKQLNEWVLVQRRSRKVGRLNEEQIKLLDDIGMKWSLKEVPMFEERFNQLIENKREHGDCNVSKREENGLGRWVQHIRKVCFTFAAHNSSVTHHVVSHFVIFVVSQQKRKRRLTEEQLKLFNDIGFGAYLFELFAFFVFCNGMNS